MSPTELATLKALVATEEARQSAGSICENRIETDDGTSEGENPMCRIDGPFKNRNKYRVRVVDRETKIAKNYTFSTKDEALAAIPKLRKQYKRVVGVTLTKALDEYRAHLTAKERRPRTIDTAIDRLEALFTNGETITGALTQTAAAAIWDEFSSVKPPRSVAYRLGVLKQAKRFLAWCSGKGWLKEPDPLASITVEGRVRKGKPQLTQDQSRRFLDVVLSRGQSGDTGAIAAATCLLLGLRASEVADRIVADLDANGTKLLITSAKTDAGIRTMVLPAVLRPLYQQLAAGKQPGDRLLGDVNRHWVLRAVHRLCKLAGVPLVPAHGLRGTHARLAVAAGISGEAVARSLGHESFAVTREHYAGGDVVAQVAIDRVADALN